MEYVKTVSFLDTACAHLPNIMSRCDRKNLSLDKIIVTDRCVTIDLPNKIKVAWLLEQECIQPDIYDYIKWNFRKFDRIITCSKELLKIIPNGIFIPFGTSFIESMDFKVYPKSKNLSMVSSSKNFTKGHEFRLQVMDFVKDKLDLFGRDVNPIDYKLEALEKYRFSVAIENSKHDYYFTEKLLDCFLTGTIPVYWGCPSIGKFFDINGVICFDSIVELGMILKNLTEDLYKSKMYSIRTNFEIAKNYTHPSELVYNLVDSM